MSHKYPCELLAVKLSLKNSPPWEYGRGPCTPHSQTQTEGVGVVCGAMGVRSDPECRLIPIFTRLNVTFSGDKDGEHKCGRDAKRRGNMENHGRVRADHCRSMAPDLCLPPR